ncbi:sulfate transporter-like isoform X2 [Rhinatrema bivittatum]|nr:sulfate transporter-like isoform X2 [Rhinatrema bivittatum]XP_029439131.1 sulfate transporter-like isoform X2 [Rhinatrema bivittatum]XP_029439132.1 sulfate transporter-like isoform X2 [Rhinatrema bivittatum]
MEPRTYSHAEQREEERTSCSSESAQRQACNYRHVRLEELVHPQRSPKELILQRSKELCKCTPSTLTNLLFKLLPVLKWLPRYQIKEQLPGDFVSGIIVGIVTIPQSIAYALLANQAPIYGIYTNFFSCIIYFFLATSHHNCVGSFGVLCLMIGEAVNKQLKIAGYIHDDGTTATSLVNATMAANGSIICDKSCYAITVATSLTFLVGVYQILLGVFQLGFIAIYLSEPLLSGFVTGSSLTILTSQVKYLFGLSIPRHEGAGSLILTWIDIFRYIKETNICDLITSLVALAVIIPAKEINDKFKSKMKIPFPVELLVIIVATLVSHYFDFQQTYKSSICGTIPTGFQVPKAPDWSLFPRLASDALPIAIIGFAMTVSLAEIFAKKHGYSVRANQEMIAIGMCNLVPSFFYSFASCAALAKTLLRESTGAHTQLSSLVTSGVLLLVLLVIAPLFYSLQNCILGVITITNLRGALRKFADTPNMWRISKVDTIVWWVSMLASSLITTEIGLLVAVCFSMLCVIFRTQMPRATLLAKVSDTEIYEDQFTYKELRSIPNVKIFRFDSSLYYANKGYFKSMLYKKTEINPALVAAMQRKAKKLQEAAAAAPERRFFPRFNLIKTSSRPSNPLEFSIPQLDMHSLIIDCGAMQFIDTVGLDVLKETRRDYEDIGILVFLANCSPSVRHLLQEGGYFKNGHGDMEQLLFHSVHDAVQFAEGKYQQQQKEIDRINAAFSFNPNQAIADDLGI